MPQQGISGHILSINFLDKTDLVALTLKLRHLLLEKEGILCRTDTTERY